MIDTLLNVATPPLAACVSVPANVPPPGFVPMANVTFAMEVVRFPEASSIRTVTAGVIAAPAIVLVGCALNFTCAAAPTVMLNVDDVSPLNDALAAVRV